jgi:protein-S-isoprenylcysteine O-methyltransferase Ste14
MRPGITQLLTRIVALAAIFALLLFLPAGTLKWPAAWIYLGLFFGFTIALSLWLRRFHPDLLNERLTGIGKRDQKTWDKILLAVTAVVFFAWLALMGLDAVRYRWSHLPLPVQEFGAILLLGSFALFFVTFRDNEFLSPAVRIQHERSQRVIDTGLYRRVRHPMYTGFVLFAFGTTLLLGSCFGLIGATLLTAIVARRAVLEERLLCEELQGYRAYMTRVKYRFVPYLW